MIEEDKIIFPDDMLLISWRRCRVMFSNNNMHSYRLGFTCRILMDQFKMEAPQVIF